MTHPKRILSRYDIAPKKSLGQNFLVETRALEKICELAELSPDDQVLEIGPGTGALTAMMAASAGRVITVELDDRLLPILLEELAAFDNVEVFHRDILNLDHTSLFAQSFKVVANLPYYITGAVLRHLMVPKKKPQLMVLTVQKEVAERLTAQPGEMSILAVSVQLHGLIRREFAIPAGSFWPKPAVDSAVIRFDKRESNLIPYGDEESFLRLVKMGFSSKRKQLQKNLRALISDKVLLNDKLRSAGIDGTRRAETLSIEEWLALYRELRG